MHKYFVFIINIKCDKTSKKRFQVEGVVGKAVHGSMRHLQL